MRQRLGGDKIATPAIGARHSVRLQPVSARRDQKVDRGKSASEQKQSQTSSCRSVRPALAALDRANSSLLAPTSTPTSIRRLPLLPLLCCDTRPHRTAPHRTAPHRIGIWSSKQSMAYVGPPKNSGGGGGGEDSFFSHAQDHDRIPGASSDAGDAPSAMVSAPSNSMSLQPDTSITQKMLSAVTGSVLTSLLVTPLDVVRVRLQAQSGPSSYNSTTSSPFARLPPNLGVSACCREVFYVSNQSQYCVASAPAATAVDQMLISECAAEETQRRTFNSTLDGLRKIARNEGLSTLWRGLSPTLAMAVPANVIYFAGYDWLRTSHSSPVTGRIDDAYAPLVAGSAARVLAAIAVSPIEMFRTRMQASHPDAATPTGVFKDTLSGVQEMVKSEGYRSLWRGLSLTLWRDVPFSAFYWWGYEYGREALHDARERRRARDPTNRPRSRSTSELDHKTVLTDSFIAGASAGAIAAFATTPFDVGKTRQQTVRHSQASSNGTPSGVRPEDRSMPRFLWHMFKTEGAAGLFKGWAARCLKVAPACAIMISSYEIGKKMAGGINEKKAGPSE
ncbi:hypothetical protein MBLNU459_g2596t1 [Dothideomycetes sp. NU459]